MTPGQERLVALAAVFEAATLVDRLARTGQISESSLNCMLGSLLVRDPQSTLDVYGGDDLNLRDGYRVLQNVLGRDTSTLQREPLRYALALTALEKKLAKRADLQALIGSRLEQIQLQVGHFGITHDNVIASFGGLYEDTLSTFRQRIQVHGEMRFLQQPGTAARIRALLLAGVRSARLWRQLGGHRWQLVFSRGRLLQELRGLVER